MAVQGDCVDLRCESFGAFYLGLIFDFTSVDYRDKKSSHGSLFQKPAQVG